MKRIIVCADGTWNTRDQINQASGKRRPSNVTKVARAIRPRDRHHVDQIVYYHDGVGSSSGLDRYTGGAFGDGMEANIRELYRFLVYNFEPQDEIYMFGFSRGAFTVRSLAGFMSFAGLVEKDSDYFVPDLYHCYQNGKGSGSPEWIKAHRRIPSPRSCPQIRFIGVWDTVGALGAPGFLGQVFRRSKYTYHDVGLRPSVEHAYHALAIDERRGPFRPNIWERPTAWSGVLQQAWFAGVHRNVGGGCEPDGLANEALHWIVEKAEALGLEFDDWFLKPYTPCFNSSLQDSMTLGYRLLGECLRPIGKHPNDGETIHRSALDRMSLDTCDYHPANLESYLSEQAAVAPAITTRVRTGTPC
jgi:uncharacterized protein (DUF2235 family)